MRGTKFRMKAKFAGEMPDFGVDPRRRAHSRQTSREHNGGDEYCIHGLSRIKAGLEI